MRNCLLAPAFLLALALLCPGCIRDLFDLSATMGPRPETAPENCAEFDTSGFRCIKPLQPPPKKVTGEKPQTASAKKSPVPVDAGYVDEDPFAK